MSNSGIQVKEQTIHEMTDEDGNKFIRIRKDHWVFPKKGMLRVLDSVMSAKLEKDFFEYYRLNGNGPTSEAVSPDPQDGDLDSSSQGQSESSTTPLEEQQQPLEENIESKS